MSVGTPATERPRPSESPRAQLVLGVGMVLVAAQLGLRAWALYPSWFFTDDYRLMLDARGVDLTWGYAWTSFDSHLMPLGRVLVWIVTDAGPLNWPLAATVVLVIQLLASVACLWMLVVLFGARWLVLLPLAVYLTSAVTAPAFMWWAAAINQVPFQAAFFCTVALWVTYLRGRRLRHLLFTLLSLGVGIGFYEKALLMGVVMAFLAFGYFASGTLRHRVLLVVRRYWPALVAAGVLVGAYLYYYLVFVPQPFEESTGGNFVADDIANTMLGTALPTGLLGGPWRWWNTSPPIVLASPPAWTVHLSWMLLLLLVLYGALRRVRTLRAWALLATYSLCLFGALAVSRGQLFGGLSGLEYRYLTDAVCVFVLVLGLVLAELDGAVESSAARAAPVLTWVLPVRGAVTLSALVAVGGLVSSFQYVQFWHHDNAGRSYVKTLRSDLRAMGPVDLADQLMPVEVMPEYTRPDNHTAVFVPMVSSHARFPTVTSDLHAVADDGSVRNAVIADGAGATQGPVAGCGWKVQESFVRIGLEERVPEGTWWVQIGYLGSADDTVTVRVDDHTVRAPVQRGLHALFVQVTGEVDDVILGGLGSGTMCVDDVEVGDVTTEGSP